MVISDWLLVFFGKILPALWFYGEIKLALVFCSGFRQPLVIFSEVLLALVFCKEI